MNIKHVPHLDRYMPIPQHRQEVGHGMNSTPMADNKLQLTYKKMHFDLAISIVRQKNNHVSTPDTIDPVQYSNGATDHTSHLRYKMNAT